MLAFWSFPLSHKLENCGLQKNRLGDKLEGMSKSIEWSQVIGDLQSSGMTQKEIAEQVDCSQGYISDLMTGRRGKSVSYAVGCKLLAMHSGIKGKTEAA